MGVEMGVGSKPVPSVPSAVVIPMTMPEVDPWAEGETEGLVGRTIMSGMPPVEPMTGVGVGRMSGKSPLEPDVGRTMISGTPPVELAGALGVGRTIMLGTPPVEPAGTLGVGRTIMSGTPPVEPAGALGVGRRIMSGNPPVEPAGELGVGRMPMSGRSPAVDVGTSGVGVGVAIGWELFLVSDVPGRMKGPRKLDDPTELGLGEGVGDASPFGGVGCTTGEGAPPVEPIKGSSSPPRGPVGLGDAAGAEAGLDPIKGSSSPPRGPVGLGDAVGEETGLEPIKGSSIPPKRPVGLGDTVGAEAGLDPIRGSSSPPRRPVGLGDGDGVGWRMMSGSPPVDAGCETCGAGSCSGSS